MSRAESRYLLELILRNREAIEDALGASGYRIAIGELMRISLPDAPWDD